MKISIEKAEVLRLSGNPSLCTLQVSGNTLKRVNLKYVGVVFTCNGGQNEELLAGLGRANTVLRELYRSVVAKREL